MISGNGARGVGVFDPGTDGNVLQGNFIGTDPLGAAAFANVMDGIDISGGARSNLIGGTMVGSANVISGNGLCGITHGGAGTDGTIVRGNLIGLDASGLAALANGLARVIVYGGARLTQLGGTTPGARNVISAHHSYDAIITDPGTQANVFQGNFVGLNAAGTAAVANTTFAGVAVFGGAQSNTVGGGVGARNVVSGNASYGVFISDTNTDTNVVQGNTSGLDPTGTIAIGNGVSGVVIQNAARSNQVGGATLGAANLIASNGTYGVVVFDTGTTNNSIAGNSIFGNGSAGIALVGDNLSRPAPLLTSAVVGTNTVVNGMLTSSPTATFRIEFFANPTGLATAQGQTFLGAISATTGSGGTVTFSAGLSSTVPPGQRVTATATDPAGNTSRFSSSVTVSTTDSDGDGLPDQWELAQFGTLAQSANGDPDGDGSTDMQEFRAGTNPKGSASALKVTFASQGGTDVIVGFPSVAARIYRVEMKDSLIQPAWAPLADQLVAAWAAQSRSPIPAQPRCANASTE